MTELALNCVITINLVSPSEYEWTFLCWGQHHSVSLCVADLTPVTRVSTEYGGAGTQTGHRRHLQHGRADQEPGLAARLLLPGLVRHHARHPGVPPHGQPRPRHHRLSQQVSEVREGRWVGSIME